MSRSSSPSGPVGAGVNSAGAGLEALTRWEERLGAGALPSPQALPDPEGALLALEALERAGQRPPEGEEALWLGRLMRLGAQSHHFGRLAARQPAVGEALRGDLERARGLEGQRAAALALGDQQERWARLRAWRMRELTRAFYREAMGLATVTVTTGEVSALASACLEAALAWTREELAAQGDAVDEQGQPIPMVIMGLGKLGGWELNFSSDVDIVYVYGADEGRVEGARGQEPWAVHNFFKRLARRLTERLEEVTPQGRLWRVDLRLRPGGAQGPLVHALRAVESYYEAWGGALERLAWLKARPVAGDLALGERLNARLAPFVYPRSLDWQALEALRALKEKIDRNAQAERLAQRRAQVEGPPLAGWDVKLGQGGIREIEFVAQALQLVYGGRQAQLRGPSTLPTLERLLAAGLLPAADVDVLAGAYVFFRLLEHRVQMEGERQTHALPSEEGELWRLGRRLGEEPEGFVARVEGARGRVQAIFGRLLGLGGKEASAVPAELQALLDLDSVEVESAQTQALFAAAGFARARQAAEQWAVSRSRPYGPYSASASPGLAAVGERLLVEVARSADPDLALFNLTSLLLSIGARAAWWEALGAAPALLTALVSLLGASRYLSRLLVGNPGLVDKLLVEEGWMTPAGLGRRPQESSSRALLEAELKGALEGLEGQEARLERLRRFRNRRELRVALADLAGLLGPREVEGALSDLAEVCLEAVVREAQQELEVRHGVARDGQGGRAGFCVLALGRLGSRELGYGSDLDLVFLHNGVGRTGGLEPVDCGSFFGKLGRRVIAFLSTTLSNGRLYAIDARLRPNGSRGTLVVTLEGFASYHRGEAAVWERQASLRARAVAGDRALGASAEAVARAQSYQAAPDAGGRAALLQALDESRRKVVASLASGRSRGYNLKLDEGGIMDVEFVVQGLQLLHGAEHPALQTTSTWAALEGIGEVGALAPAQVEALREGYATLRRLESRLRMLEGKGESALDLEDREALRGVARRAGYRGVAPAEALLQDLARVRGGVRGVYRQVFGVV